MAKLKRILDYRILVLVSACILIGIALDGPVFTSVTKNTPIGPTMRSPSPPPPVVSESIPWPRRSREKAVYLLKEHAPGVVSGLNKIRVFSSLRNGEARVVLMAEETRLSGTFQHGTQILVPLRGALRVPTRHSLHGPSNLLDWRFSGICQKRKHGGILKECINIDAFPFVARFRRLAATLPTAVSMGLKRASGEKMYGTESVKLRTRKTTLPGTSRRAIEISAGAGGDAPRVWLAPERTMHILGWRVRQRTWRLSYRSWLQIRSTRR